MSHVICHMSGVRCHVSRVTCNIFLKYFFTKWWNFSGEGLLSTGPTPSSFYTYMDIFLFFLKWWSYSVEGLLSTGLILSSFLIRVLARGQKCPTELLNSWKLRHHLTYLRLLFHHHILNWLALMMWKKHFSRHLNSCEVSLLTLTCG